MRSLVVDTNVVSFLLRRDSRRELYREDLTGARLCVAFVTVAELRFGALNRNWGPKRMDELAQALRAYVTIGFDDDTVWQFATIADRERRAGRHRENPNDWWIAACALRHGIPLVTHNPRDFVGIPGLQLLSHAPDAPK